MGTRAVPGAWQRDGLDREEGMMEAHPRLEPRDPGDDVALARRLLDARRAIDEAVERVIVGQDAVRALVLGALLSRGHALLVGGPGLAKTLLAQTIARALDLRLSRIQFTPDPIPSDIPGTEAT